MSDAIKDNHLIESPEHIILHLGFHKTGTTSAQTYLLRHHEALLAQGVRVCRRKEMEEIGYSGLTFGIFPNFWTYFKFRKKFRKLLMNLDSAPVMIISRENFAGAIPGHRRYRLFRHYGYGLSTRVAAKMLVKELRRHYGEGVKLTVVFTVRNQEQWIKSAWGHILRTLCLKLDYDQFAEKMRKQLTLEEEVDQIKATIGDLADVVTERFEDHKDGPFGPAGALLKYTDVREPFKERRTRLKSRLPSDPPHLQEKFLELNRSQKDTPRLQQTKEALRKEWLKQLRKNK